ncbi:uncharacterized protein LOC132699823 [Cylas formicarius]|uniref:uncharacterized protein LOC132699823 n=1 Tax=Cylas formicarius TaxID=197179 RepID=UPI002958B479|nr:uncharacterized protein LOC132699823 [Cylas formicarius]
MRSDECFEASPPCQSQLDSALHELGMLASSTNSRREYLNEVKTSNYLNMLTINTRYVSNVSIGFRVRPTVPHARFIPYKVPHRERHRTKSENNDSDATSTLAQVIVDECISESFAEVTQLKKAKSLESLVAANETDANGVRFGSHIELDKVSDSIQNLKVAE